MNAKLFSKTCKDCGVTKRAIHFYRHSSYADGRMNSCKRCKIAYVIENKELKDDHYRAYKRRWSARPEQVEKRRAYAKSERGRQVHRDASRRYHRVKRLLAS